jgi:ribonuclease HI
MSNKITIYTDGSAVNGTHDKGGYGIVFINGSVRQFAGGQYSHTTSARMEVLAIVKALEKCKPGDIVTVYSDNEYAVNTLQKKWIFKWVDENFRGRKNKDLWRSFYIQYQRLHCKVTLKWIRGHDGNEYNEIADRLARIGSKRVKIIKDQSWL